jgi:hypothetical protein
MPLTFCALFLKMCRWTVMAEDLAHKKMPLPAAQAAYAQALDFIANVDPFDVETIAAGLRAIGETATENKAPDHCWAACAWPSPAKKYRRPLFESIVVLGRQRTAQRLQEALALLS